MVHHSLILLASLTLTLAAVAGKPGLGVDAKLGRSSADMFEEYLQRNGSPEQKQLTGEDREELRKIFLSQMNNTKFLSADGELVSTKEVLDRPFLLEGDEFYRNMNHFGTQRASQEEEDDLFGNSASIDSDWAEFVANNIENIEEVPMEYSIAHLLGPVRDQGECSSDWAHSSTAALESGLADFAQKNHGFPTSADMNLSEQYILDCTDTTGLFINCSMGAPIASSLFTLISGAASEEEIPYTGLKDDVFDGFNPEKCVEKEENFGKRSEQYIERSVSPETSDEAKKALIMYKTALSVSIQMLPPFKDGPTKWGDDGIWDCDKALGNFRITAQDGSMDWLSDAVDSYKSLHSMNIVGFKDDYWIVRNSWGPTWGNGDGHLYIKIDSCPMFFTPLVRMHGFKVANPSSEMFPGDIREHFSGGEGNGKSSASSVLDGLAFARSENEEVLVKDVMNRDKSASIAMAAMLFLM